MSGFWGQVGWVIRKDIRVELRGGEAFLITAPFGALALLLVPMALGTETTLLRQIGPGMLWVVVLLFGMLVTVRTTSIDTPQIRTLLTLNGLDPAASFVGRSVASALLLLALLVVLTPVMVVLYASPRIVGWVWLAALAIAAAVGLGLLGSFAGSLVAGLRSRTALAPLLVAPLAVPVLLAATQGTDLALAGRSIMAWLLLLVAMDLALAIAGVLLAAPLDETAG